MTEIRRALLSVSDKTGLVPFAKGLAARGVELVASAGTATALQEAGLTVTLVDDVTGAAEMLGGRVKTLHPSIHGGILARRDVPEDLAALRERDIRPIDLVVVNLYPFQRLAMRRGVPEAELVEHIDVGGPAMLRAAAKNFAHVAVVVSPERYGFVLDELGEGDGSLSLGTRRELAAEAFAHSASYEIAIANWFMEGDAFPDRLFAEFTREQALPYGENPHQRAAYYAERGARRHVLSMVHQHAGRPLSFNNIADLSAGRELLREFSLPGCVIIKHQNPCGVADGEKAGMHHRMQGLHPAVEHLGEGRHLGDVADREPDGADRRRGATGRNEFDAAPIESGGELDQTRLVGHRQQRPFDRNEIRTHASRSSARRLRTGRRPPAGPSLQDRSPARRCG